MVYAQTEFRFNPELEHLPNPPPQRGFSIETFASADHPYPSPAETTPRGIFT
jgi:hypothetical protein